MAILSPIRNVISAKNKDVLLVLCLQLILLVLFGIFARYEDKDANFKLQVYPMFQDVHVMIFIGFGYLMTFLKRYGFSAVGFNFLLAAIIVQWAIICEGFYELASNNYKISLNVLSLLRADVASATVLISMGALLGNTSYTQLIIMGFIEIIVFSANSYLGSKILKVVDAGDSIFVHAFGAYFGLSVSYVLGRKQRGSGEVAAENQLESSSYTSDLFAMIGTVFLWMFWPSFNSAELEGDQQVRAIINTYLSLTSCCVSAFLISSVLTPNNKFDMVHIQNSTLAGGVAVGTSANLMLQPYGALIVGICAGVLSVYGYSVITPFLNKSFNIHDTCGVHNLHGMPAIMAGLVGALMAGLASENDYHLKLYQVFPAMASTEIIPGPQHPLLTTGDGRTAGQQAGYQILAVVLTLIISIISGLITGFLIKAITNIKIQDAYTDDIAWQIHETHSNEAQEVINENETQVEAPISSTSEQQIAADIENSTS